ncbi:MAG: hypothetical protein JJ863_15490 [Deltaproteobacteria bacterium]|nr:hypothetical protein [Deltaproteobacteria bacterium]
MIWPFKRRTIPPPIPPQQDWWVEILVNLEGEGILVDSPDGEREVQGYIAYLGLRCTDDEVMVLVETTVDVGRPVIESLSAVDINAMHRDVRTQVPDEVPSIWCRFSRIYY